MKDASFGRLRDTYPVLLGLYPIAHLFAANALQLRLKWLVVPVVLSVVLGVCCISISHVVVRKQADRRVLAACLVLTASLSGHLVRPVTSLMHAAGFASGMRIATAALLVISFSMLFGAAVLWPALRDGLDRAGFRFSVTLLLVAIAVAAVRQYSATQERPQVWPADLTAWWQSCAGRNTTFPPIVHIVVDGHARGDVLRRFYSYNDEAFERDLDIRGFRVIDGARSNYSETALSLASMFSLHYLPDYARFMSRTSRDYRPLFAAIDNNEVFRLAKALGYNVVWFSSGWLPTNANSGASKVLGSPSMLVKNDLVMMLLRGSAMWLVAPGLVWSNSLTSHRDILYTLNHVPDAAVTTQQPFVFAHIIAPHPPYLLDRQGGSPPPAVNAGTLDEQWLRRGAYVDATVALDSMLIRMIDHLDRTLSQKAVVILSSDHGPWQPSTAAIPFERERTSVFLALRGPASFVDALPDTASLVNVYRALFGALCGSPLPLLPDSSMFSIQTPYNWHRVQ